MPENEWKIVHKKFGRRRAAHARGVAMRCTMHIHLIAVNWFSAHYWRMARTINMKEKRIWLCAFELAREDNTTSVHLLSTMMIPPTPADTLNRRAECIPFRCRAAATHTHTTQPPPTCRSGLQGRRDAHPQRWQNEKKRARTATMKIYIPTRCKKRQRKISRARKEETRNR